jgi:enterochelin esterase-like enzyme
VLLTHRARRPWSAVTALALVGLVGLVAPADPAQAKPQPAAVSSSVAPLPTSALAQSSTPNPKLDGARFATFTYRSSTATSVSVVGGFGPSDQSFTSPMSRTDDGVFSTIIGPLRPGVYGYSLTVDGVRTVDPANPNVVHADPKLTQFLVPGKGAHFLTKHHVAHGKVSVLTYHSDVTGSDRKATVWTPPGYPRRATAYPTMYVYHGGGGDYLDWVEQGRANVILDNLFAAGKLAPMVVVMGDGNLPVELADPAKDPFIPDVLDNLVPAVRTNFQVSHRRADQAIAGLSLGGLQVFNTVLAKPGQFRYVGDFSSGYFPAGRATLATSSYLSAANVRKVNRRTRVFRIYIGNKVDIAYNNNVATRALLDSHGVRYQFGGSYRQSSHSWNTWRHNLKDFASRVF